MNYGTFGFQDYSRGHQMMIAELPARFPTLNTALEYPNPFGGPCIIRPVLKFTAAAIGFRAGEYAYVLDKGADGGSTNVGVGISKVAFDKINLRTASLASGPFNILGIDGTNDIAFGQTEGVLLGAFAIGAAIRGRPQLKLRPARRFVTPLKPLAVNSNYSWPNLVGEQPASITAKLRNRLPELGFKNGDVIEWNSMSQNSNTTRMQIMGSPKVVALRTSASAVYINFSSGAEAALTFGNWDVFLDVIA